MGRSFKNEKVDSRQKIKIIAKLRKRSQRPSLKKKERNRN